jgi:hypothetical protein
VQRKLPYFLGLLIVMISYRVSGQGVEYEYAKENNDVVHAFETVDSLSSKSLGLFSNTSDSLKHLSDYLETSTQSRIDSLQQKLEALKKPW